MNADLLCNLLSVLCLGVILHFDWIIIFICGEIPDII